MTDLEDDLTSLLPALPDRPSNPAHIGWPPSLPAEIALGERSLDDILQGYKISARAWERLQKDPAFQVVLKKYVDMIQTDGMTFKLKAMLQSEALLDTTWQMIHDPDTPHNVRADLIKYVCKVAGHEPKGADGGNGAVVPFQININLG